MFHAAACQTSFECPRRREEIGARTARMCEIVEQTIVGYEPFFDVRLLAFPEFAHAAPIHDSVRKLRDTLAVPVPNEHTDRYAAVAARYGCYIQTGTFLEADPDWPEAVFNTYSPDEGKGELIILDAGGTRCTRSRCPGAARCRFRRLPISTATGRSRSS